MKVLLALNSPDLIEYISNLNNVEVCEVFEEIKSVERKVKEHLPQVLIMSHSLFKDDIDEIKEVIQRVTSKDFHDFRIIYLYGKDDDNRVKFIDFLIRCGVYDYYFGSKLTEDIINELIFNPKMDRRLVKHDILPDSSYLSDINDPKALEQMLSELPEEKRKEFGFINERIVEVPIEKVYEKDKFLDTILIGVAGASSGIGCTHTAISIAYFLSKLDKEFNIAVLEVNRKSDFIKIKDDYPQALNEFSFVYEDIDFYTNKTSLTQILSLRSKKQYNYIILDFGKIKDVKDNALICNDNYSEFLRSSVPILVCGSKPWQIDDIKIALYKNKESNDFESDNWKLLFNFVDDEILYNIKNDFDWDIYMMPFCPKLFSHYNELDNTFLELLSTVIPKVKEVPKKGFKFPKVKLPFLKANS